MTCPAQALGPFPDRNPLVPPGIICVEGLERLLRANTQPSGMKRTVLPIIEYQISLYDTEISQLSAKREYAARFASLFAPIRTLPPEVLLQIFKIASLHTRITTTPPTAIQDLPTSALSQVCNFWRELILPSQELWSTIMIKVDVNSESSYSKILKMYSPEPTTILRLYLERAGDIGLNLDFDIDWFEEPDLALHPAIVMLTERAGFWREVSIGVFIQPVPFEPPTLPMLERLELDMGLYSFSCESITRFDASKTPKLQSLTLKELSPDENSWEGKWQNKMLLNFNWPQLKHLELQFPPSELCEKVLFQCNTGKLERLMLHLHEKAKPFDGQHRSPFAVPFLSLTIPPNHTSFFETFTFSSLEAMELFADDAEHKLLAQAFPLSSFSSFVEKSDLGITITTFRLVGWRVSDIDTISILRLLPSILDLTLDSGSTHGTFITESFMDALTFKFHPFSTPLLPKLVRLELKGSDSNPPPAETRIASDASFVRMITSRVNPMGNVQKLKFALFQEPSRSFDPSNFEVMRRLGRNGLVIVVRDKEGFVDL